MNITDYVFEGHWQLLKDVKPANAQRVLLTNGDSIVIGSLTIQDDMIHWLFDRGNMDGYNSIAWMDLPSVTAVKKHEVPMEQVKVGI